MYMEQEVRDKILDVIKDYFDEIEDDIEKRLRCVCDNYSKIYLENLQLVRDYPVIEDALYYDEKVTLKKKEHKALVKYLSNLFWMEHEERLDIYFQGHADCIAYFKRIGVINFDFEDMKSLPKAESIRLNVLKEVLGADEFC